MNIKNALNHLETIRTHCKWVRYYGEKADLSWWQRFKHDLSKYSPTEFFESIKYYQGTSSPIDAAKKDKGYSDAWFHHRGRNPHHYEYWQDNFDHGGEPVQMPYKYAAELICDYLAAGRTYMGDKFTYHKEYEWWLNKRTNCAMHPHTKRFVSLVFKELKMRESENWLEGYVNDNLLTGRLMKGYYNLATRQLEKGIEFDD